MLQRPDIYVYLLVIKANNAPILNLKPKRFRIIYRGFEKIYKLLKKFISYFKKELPNKLPPIRNYKHRIDIGNIDLININIYPLSPIYL